ncbi:MAG TPA: type VI secretion system baseplate subunit TssE [Gemmataceae bacterium]|nr:type VI secretion system baseplate subunit TssE [Gemmataceae bacterium]
MAPDEPTLLVPSVFDRLTDPDPEGYQWRHGYSLDDLAAAVQRDLEALLNTSMTHPRLPEVFVQTRKSVFAYGLPEVITRRLSDPEEQLSIARVLENTIRLFEPRLDDVVAEPVPGSDGGGVAKLRFRVRARLVVAGDIAYDTVLELTTGRCHVRPSSEMA